MSLYSYTFVLKWGENLCNRNFVMSLKNMVVCTRREPFGACPGAPKGPEAERLCGCHDPGAGPDGATTGQVQPSYPRRGAAVPRITGTNGGYTWL